MFRATADLLRMSWRQDPRKLLVALLLMAGNAAAAPLAALWLKRLSDDVVAGQAAGAAWNGAGVAFWALGALTFAHFAHIAYFEISELAVLTMDGKLFETANRDAGLAQVEDPRLADELALLKQEMQRMGEGLQAVLAGSSLAVSMVLTGILLASVDPLLLVLPLLALPSLHAARRAAAILDGAREATAAATRANLHMVELATTAATAKELRTLRLADQIRRRRREAWEEAGRRLSRAQFRAALWQAGGQTVFACGYAAGLLLVIRTAVDGHGGVGDVVLSVVLAAQVNQQVGAAVPLFQQIQRSGRAFRRLSRVRAEVTAARTGAPEVAPLAPSRPPSPVPYRRTVPTRPVPRRLTKGIELRNVSLRYPGADRPVLSEVSLTLPAARTVAIVGENGAGKTTLVKLLCRLYEPTSGHILVDGLDLSTTDPAHWHQRIAAGFQDFVRFEFDAREAVGVGDLPRAGDGAAVTAALRRAGTEGVVRGLPDGLATVLGKSRTGGTDLSGGQWQQLALGRAMMREAPLLLVLDEPTAALDAEAEHRLFQRYARNATRVGAATGAITVLVSHRFSTVRMADLIVVVADGGIHEAGTHDELIARAGLYAELYGVQSAAYR
ncbi:ABC transporter ATP-binding protein [Streptomyces sp. NPDC051771]|uniref:ABC transporter ATP-binding protein n=1 Tax=Streptomyces sp. NPDC051771 TaxID=3154847 RepID=UPI0034341CDD